MPQRRNIIAHATTRAEEMAIVRAPEPQERGAEPQEPFSGPCSSCRWQEVCTGDGVCWEAQRGVRVERPKLESLYTRRERWSDDEQIIAALKAYHQRHGTTPRQDQWYTSTEEHPSYSLCTRRFGSWRKALAAAGLEAPTRGWHAKRIRR